MKNRLKIFFGWCFLFVCQKLNNKLKKKSLILIYSNLILNTDHESALCVLYFWMTLLSKDLKIFPSKILLLKNMDYPKFSILSRKTCHHEIQGKKNNLKPRIRFQTEI